MDSAVLSANKKTQVGIVVFAYNHDKFIGQCLESIVHQEFDGDLTVFVVDDASTDDTRNIIQSYIDKYPHVLKPVFNVKNLGPYNAYFAGFKHLDNRFEFVGQIEGDDFWNSNHKIQRQVDILKNNRDLSGCGHNCYLEYFGTERAKEPMISKPYPEKNTIQDLISGNAYFHTSTLLWKNVFQGKMPKSYRHILAGDWFLSMLYAEHGPIFYIDECLSTYRIQSKGMWSSLTESQRVVKNIAGMAAFNKLLARRYDHEFSRIWWSCNSLFETYSLKDLGRVNYLRMKALRKSIQVTANPNRYKRTFYKYIYEALNLFDLFNSK